jgi:hypothetical protein
MRLSYRIGSWGGLPGVYDRVSCLNEIADRVRQNHSGLADSEVLARLSLVRSIVAVHVMLIQVVVYQPNGSPVLRALDLEHDGVLMNRTSTHAYEDAGIRAAERYLELVIKLHEGRWQIESDSADDGDDGQQQYA